MKGPYRPEYAVWSPNDWAGPQAAFVEVELHGGPPESAAIVLNYRQAVAGEDAESVTLEIPGVSIDLAAKKAEVRIGIGLSLEGTARLRDLLADVLVDYEKLEPKQKL